MEKHGIWHLQSRKFGSLLLTNDSKSYNFVSGQHHNHIISPQITTIVQFLSALHSWYSLRSHIFFFFSLPIWWEIYQFPHPPSDTCPYFWIRPFPHYLKFVPEIWKHNTILHQFWQHLGFRTVRKLDLMPKNKVGQLCRGEGQFWLQWIFSFPKVQNPVASLMGTDGDWKFKFPYQKFRQKKFFLNK